MLGEGCARLHDTMMRDLRVQRIEVDEIWSYIGKKAKARHARRRNGALGDQYTFIALADTAKAIICYLTGKRE